MVEEGWRWRGLGLEAEETSVGAGAEGDDLFLVRGGEEEAVDEVVDCFGTDVGTWCRGPSASRF